MDKIIHKEKDFCCFSVLTKVGCIKAGRIIYMGCIDAVSIDAVSINSVKLKANQVFDVSLWACALSVVVWEVCRSQYIALTKASGKINKEYNDKYLDNTPFYAYNLYVVLKSLEKLTDRA